MTGPIPPRLAVPVLVLALLGALLAAAPLGADKTSTSTSTSTTTTTADPAADWGRQGCAARFGAVDAPTALPPADDGAGCQFLLHDWRNAELAEALALLREAQAALDVAAIPYNAARDVRNAAVGVVKAAEIGLAEIVAVLHPPPSTTTTLPPPKKTTTTTTVPPRTLQDVIDDWHLIGPLGNHFESCSSWHPIWQTPYTAHDWCDGLVAEYVALGGSTEDPAE